MNQRTPQVEESGCLRGAVFGCLFGIVGGLLGFLYGVRDFNHQVDAFLAENPDATVDWLPVGPILWMVRGMLATSLLGVVLGILLPPKRTAA